MTIDSPPAPAGLRERKKRETARAIEVAAVELAAEQSLAEVTIEAISARADVTSRTFFNYYASKEDAVLGVSRAFPRPGFDELTPLPGYSVIETLLHAVTDQLGSLELGSADFQAKKRRVMLENPHLLARDFQTIGDIEAELAVVARRLLDADGTVPEAERENHAWANVSLLGAVLRLAMQSWSRDSGSGAPVADHLGAAFRTLRAVARDA
ncbi:TetR/AcrR family transcriptional regulator [Herbiconiux sp. CPCC 205716]|uniref:TetR/AcrR family transcriptional regulator n=1 Tax=Herbiconiux gentiana TaxID=2970912 RepID=A0ABT2GEX6_9MICO|nr:helix-turn-helix domain-containing protein [Herbiconiux gentiana]MCS5713449.1 TetR/AcrR family transcriptional regulator [Herbiconiux gentiana]